MKKMDKVLSDMTCLMEKAIAAEKDLLKENKDLISRDNIEELVLATAYRTLQIGKELGAIDKCLVGMVPKGKKYWVMIDEQRKVTRTILHREE